MLAASATGLSALALALVVVAWAGGQVLYCVGETSSYRVMASSNEVTLVNATCSGGYVDLWVKLNTSKCPSTIEIVKHGVSITIIPSVEKSTDEGCLLELSTRSISPLRLGYNDSLTIILPGGGVDVERMAAMENQTTTTPAPPEKTGGGGTSVFIPVVEGERGSNVDTDKMPRGDSIPVEAVVAIALLTLTAIVAVKEYGPARRGN